MKARPRRLLPAVLAALATASLASGEPSPAALRRAIDPIVTRRALASASWGIEVRSLKSGDVLYRHDERRSLRPASTLKLVTTAVALDVLSPSARIRTSLETAGRLDARGRIVGDLYLVGRGDPTLSARARPGQATTAFEELAGALVALGVRRIEGRLVGHEGAFAGERRGHDWTWEDLVWGFGAEVSALSWNAGVVEARLMPGERAGEPAQLDLWPATPLLPFASTVSTGASGTEEDLLLRKDPVSGRILLSGLLPLGGGWSGRLAVPDPALFATSAFAAALAARGIQVSGEVVTSREALPDGLRALAAHESAPLGEIVREVNKDSLNAHAEALLRLVGLRASGVGSFESGRDAALQVLERLGVPTEGWLVSDGCGLARSNLVTASGLAALLLAMDRHPHAAAFRESLPVAGQDGTLEWRLGGARGRIAAKTGTLASASTLAGYVTTTRGDRLAFAILLDNHAGGAREAQAAVDAVALALVTP